MSDQRRGFTLVEVIVALTVTGLAIASAGVALSAARGTTARIQSHEQQMETEGRFRTVLTDMLRHAPLAEQVDEPLIAVVRPDGNPQLSFLSRGVREPYGTGEIWRVEVALRDTVLTVRATPLRPGTTDRPLVAALSPVRTFDVQLLEYATALDAARWRPDWPLAQDRPQAIALSWQRTVGEAIAPLRVLLAPIETARR